jgi:two-component system chemotaxis response regulator CheY
MTKTILIVDDSASLREVVGIAIKSAGYHLIEAADGREALTKLNGEKIHLMVIDLNMPVMDGIAFIKAVKQHPDYKFTPFILLTTEVDAEKKRIVKEAGAKAWVNKPFQVAVLLAAIAKFASP